LHRAPLSSLPPSTIGVGVGRRIVQRPTVDGEAASTRTASLKQMKQIP